MSTNTDSDRVNQLLGEKRYEDAKAILRLSTDPEAQQWLAKLEQLFPTPPEMKRAPEVSSDFGSYGLENQSRYGQVSISRGSSASGGRYGQPTRLPYQRGGCLTAYLIVIAVVNILGLFLGASVFSLIFAIFLIICVYGVWNTQKWGYFGLMAANVLNLLVGVLLLKSVFVALGAIIGLTIAYALINPQLEYFS